MSFDHRRYMDEKRLWVNAELETRLASSGTPPVELHDAMRYAILGGGKRLRAVICLACADAAGGAPGVAAGPALALELLHGYTLIHDDLPCMDDDDIRRGLPTVHVKYGQAAAVLAGDALQALAFEWAAAGAAPAPHTPTAIVTELAQAAGSLGVVGGQVMDLAAEQEQPSAEAVARIHRLKTAMLFRCAARMGAIAAGAGDEILAGLTQYGENVGLAFQIADDVLNASSTAQQIGKPAGSDAERSKTTAVAVYGLDGARQRADDLVSAAVDALVGLPGPVDPLHAIAHYITSRTH
ncbi:MAG: polyprenyl synthetase family protein [Verrucomicrobia bacterium]|nr:polyprenyl synthetase family protein [Verrucomicrobiota bacterium]MDA1085472.1 polyprenyl synthetase family protein [Verrucomicrobiota bacterium]